jgi:hypothetical protein
MIDVFLFDFWMDQSKKFSRISTWNRKKEIWIILEDIHFGGIIRINPKSNYLISLFLN